MVMIMKKFLQKIPSFLFACMFICLHHVKLVIWNVFSRYICVGCCDSCIEIIKYFRNAFYCVIVTDSFTEKVPYILLTNKLQNINIVHSK